MKKKLYFFIQNRKQNCFRMVEEYHTIIWVGFNIPAELGESIPYVSAWADKTKNKAAIDPGCVWEFKIGKWIFVVEQSCNVCGVGLHN